MAEPPRFTSFDVKRAAYPRVVHGQRPGGGPRQRLARLGEIGASPVDADLVAPVDERAVDSDRPWASLRVIDDGGLVARSGVLPYP